MATDSRTALPYAATAVSAYGAAAVAGRVLAAHPPGGAQLWDRHNHAGATVSLLEGPAYVAGAALGAVVGARVARGRATVPRAGQVAAALAAAAGALGLIDDLRGDSASKGLRGHLTALARGQVTTGAVKILGLGAAGVLAADSLRPVDSRGARRLADALVGGGVIAGSANLANLLDLRPGRALKAVTIVAGVLAGSPRRQLPGAAALGAAAATLPGDLAGRTMLGDTGANSAGALVGAAIVAQVPRGARAAVLAIVVGLTLASERVSFTAVIESTPVLRELDAWGRR